MVCIGLFASWICFWLQHVETMKELKQVFSEIIFVLINSDFSAEDAPLASSLMFVSPFSVEIVKEKRIVAIYVGADSNKLTDLIQSFIHAKDKWQSSSTTDKCDIEIKDTIVFGSDPYYFKHHLCRKLMTVSVIKTQKRKTRIVKWLTRCVTTPTVWVSLNGKLLIRLGTHKQCHRQYGQSMTFTVHKTSINNA